MKNYLIFACAYACVREDLISIYLPFWAYFILSMRVRNLRKRPAPTGAQEEVLTEEPAEPGRGLSPLFTNFTRYGLKP